MPQIALAVTDQRPVGRLGVVGVVLALVVVAVLGSARWATVEAHRSIESQVTQGERIAAFERAEQVRDVVRGIHDRAGGLASTTAVRAVVDRRAQLSGPSLATLLLANPSVVGVTISVGTDVLVQTGEGDLGFPDGTVVLEGNGRYPAFIVHEPIVDGEETAAGLLTLRVALRDELASFTSPVRAFDGSFLLIDQYGRTLLGNGRLVGRGGHRIGATAPVPDLPWKVAFVVDGRTVSRPAQALVWRLALVLVATSLFVVGMLAVLFVLFERHRRRIERERRSALTRAGTDPLTGLGNRRRLGEVVAELAAQDAALAIVTVDLDGFKALNDERGHAAGDAALRSVATALRSVVRDGDHVVRLGGDEFAVLLPEGDEEIAMHLAHRVRRAVQAVEVAGFGPLDASVGTACGDAGHADALFERADVALYHEKRARRGGAVTLHSVR